MPDAIPLRALTAEAWAPFGTILEIARPDPAARQRRRERVQGRRPEPERRGWRLAVQIVRARALRQIGHHPNTKESFEPVAAWPRSASRRSTGRTT